MIKVDCVSKVANTMLKSAKKPVLSNLGLPAKIALGAMAALTTDTLVKSSRSNCDDYEGISVEECYMSYYCI